MRNQKDFIYLVFVKLKKFLDLGSVLFSFPCVTYLGVTWVLVHCPTLVRFTCVIILRVTHVRITYVIYTRYSCTITTSLTPTEWYRVYTFRYSCTPSLTPFTSFHFVHSVRSFSHVRHCFAFHSISTHIYHTSD